MSQRKWNNSGSVNGSLHQQSSVQQSVWLATGSSQSGAQLDIHENLVANTRLPQSAVFTQASQRSGCC